MADWNDAKGMDTIWEKFLPGQYEASDERISLALHQTCSSHREMKVEVVCECIIIEESLPAYAFVLNNLFCHGIRRPNESVGLIIGNCMLTDALLPMVGLSTRTTNIFYDQLHLMIFFWPNERISSLG